MSSDVTFASLGVRPRLVEALGWQRITEPFEIQALVVPDGIAGLDILGRAPTGSGKTLGFGVPTLDRLAELPRAQVRRPRALVLSPTRELAEQIAQELTPLADAVDRRVLAVYGGVNIAGHIRALGAGVDLLVACPGRLLDLIDQGAVDLGDVVVAVVDEADRMSDMGFLPDVRRLLDRTGKRRQTMLFSATLDDEVQVLVERYQRDPVVHEVGEVEPDLTTMEHRFIQVDRSIRPKVAADLVAAAGSTVVFTRTRHGADRLAKKLRQQGVTADHLHGGRSQAQRDRALQGFVDGRVQALVATDVAARGIHVDDVACVIHYDPPADHKDYVHRSGRTARAGATGTVISILDPSQLQDSAKLRRALGIDAEVEPTPEDADRDRTPIVVSADRSPSTAKGRGRARGTGKRQQHGGGSRGDGETGSRRSKGSGDDGRAGTSQRSGGGGRSGATRSSKRTPSGGGGASDRPGGRAGGKRSAKRGGKRSGAGAGSGRPHGSGRTGRRRGRR
ncbi:MAG: DEAD/DEAH box helicase [Actinomycetota bacterium]